jgi:hypothetical protein
MNSKRWRRKPPPLFCPAAPRSASLFPNHAICHLHPGRAMHEHARYVTNAESI